MGNQRSQLQQCVAEKPTFMSVMDPGTKRIGISPVPQTLGHTSDGEVLFCGANCVQPATEPQGQPSELLVLTIEEWKQVIGIGKDGISPTKDIVSDLYPALRKLGIKGKAAIKVVNGKSYVIIAGYPGLRKILTGTRYLASNAKVADLVIGTKALGRSALKSTPLAIGVIAAADVLQFILDDKDLLSRELGFTLLVDIGKSGIASLCGFIAGAALTAAGAPVVVPIAAGIVLAIVVGKALDDAVPTDQLVKAMEDYFDDLFARMGRYLNDLERQILWMVWPHHAMAFPY